MRMGKLGMRQMHRVTATATLWTRVYGSMPFFLFFLFYSLFFSFMYSNGGPYDENWLGIWNICTWS